MKIECRLSCKENRPTDEHRRKLCASTSKVISLLGSSLLPLSKKANAAIGTLPELAGTNVFLHGISVKVADKSQQDAMINFLCEGFEGFQVLRKRIRGSIEETWLGFGPETVDIPDNFVIPVSSFSLYGGHASIHLIYDADLKSPLYRLGSNVAPGSNIAYLQVSVPGYRISKIQSSGGVITDAYGLVNVISPCGLPVRGIVGIWPDPLMFVAINCEDVKKSKLFYEQLGFMEMPMPYSRPSLGSTIFEPAPPSGSVYLSPCAKGGMGILLLSLRKQTTTPNRVVQSLNLVYNPSSDLVYNPSSVTDDESASSEISFDDPSGVHIRFQSVQSFAIEEKETR